MALSITPVGGAGTWVYALSTSVSKSVTYSAGDLLIALTQCQTTFGSLYDSNSGTWTLQVQDAIGATRIYSQVVSLSGSMTVTVTQSLAYGIGLHVFKVTGYLASGPFGATGYGSSGTQNINPTLFTSTVAGSTALVNAGDYNHKGTPSSLDLDWSETYTNGISGIAGPKSLGAVGSQTANLDAAASGPAWYWAAVELIPAPLAGAVTGAGTGSGTVAGSAQTPANVTGAGTGSASIGEAATDYANVTGAGVGGATATIPVPMVAGVGTGAGSVAATQTPPLSAGATGHGTGAAVATAHAQRNAYESAGGTGHARVTAVASGALPQTVYGTLQIGRLTLTEAPEQQGQSSTGTRQITVSGMEASAVLTAGQTGTRDRLEGLLAYDQAIVPVVWQSKGYWSGWYQVSGPSVQETTWLDTTVVTWTTSLTRVGQDSEVEVESRLVGGNRPNATSSAPVLWHAPPIGADSYIVGYQTPGWVVRNCADGTLLAYVGLTPGVNPRWSIPAANWLLGAASIAVAGVVRTGTTCPDAPASWVLSNGIIEVQPPAGSGALQVTSWLVNGWGTSKTFDLKRGGSSLGPPTHVTILRNDPCEVVVRLTWDLAPGRVTCDLGLKRGSRFVSLFVQQFEVAGVLSVDSAGAADGGVDYTGSAGYVAGATADADGNSWVVGSPLSVAASNTLGVAQVTPAQGLPAFVGCVYAAGAAQTGDAAADLSAQYLGSPVETERVVLR